MTGPRRGAPPGSWTPQDIPDLSGCTAVVTGANSGLGLHTALGLARARARVLLACRDPTRGGTALARVQGAARGPAPDLVVLDLADLGSVRSAAADIAGRTDQLALLVNNAGVMAIPRRETADGFEMQLGTNHLGHFALTGRLLPLLAAGGTPSRPSRVVTVSSGAHVAGRIAFDDLHGRRRYRRWAAYSQSKLANLLFAAELARRATAAALPLVSVAAHPGYAATNLQAVGPRMDGSPLRERAMALANRLLAQSDEQGAEPLLYAAVADDVGPGDYLGPGGLLGMRGHPTHARVHPRARDRDAAARLWQVSEQLTGVAYLSGPPRPDDAAP